MLLLFMAFLLSLPRSPVEKGSAARRAKTPVNHMGWVGFRLVSFARDTNSRPPSGILSGNGLGEESRGEDRPQANPGGAVGETLMRRAMQAAGRGVKQAEVSSLARMECLSVGGGSLSGVAWSRRIGIGLVFG
jgi:hypothetical protein